MEPAQARPSHFANPRVTEAALKELADFRNLTGLDLSSMTLQTGLAALAGLKKLTVLNLGRSTLSDAAMKDLTRLPSLQELNC